MHTRFRIHNYFLWMILIFGLQVVLQAQILDDSSKQLYGYHTLRYGTEDEVFLNKGLNLELDSSLASIQRYGYIYKNGQYSQDLGNWSTPLKCITSTIPTQLGVQTGFGVFSPYEYNADDVKYFDTRSPYAEIKYYQGSRGQQSIDLSFTRNINSQWNIGIDLRRIVSKMIIGYYERNQKQAEHYAFDFYVSHHSKNKRYFLLANFTYLEAHNFDTGGIKPDSTDTKDDLFQNQLEQVWLTNVRSLDKRYNYRVYQHYGLLDGEKLQAFYRFDYSHRTNRYDDTSLTTNRQFYQQYGAYNATGYYNFKTISDRTDFNLFDNRVGLKGTTNNFFYAVYLKNRYVTMNQSTYSNVVDAFNRYTTEWYVAGQLRRYLDKEQKSFVEVDGEWGIASNTNSNQVAQKIEPNKMAAFCFYRKGLKLEASTWSVSPTLLQSNYRSDLVKWDTSFVLQKTQRLVAEYKFTKKKIDIIPGLTYSVYDNFIYFDTTGKPSQFKDGSIQHIQAKLGLRFNMWKIHVYNEFQYNDLSNGSQIMQMPKVVNITQLFVESWLFNKATLVQTGFDISYRTAFQANGYNPLIQQYYVTNQTGTGDKSFNYINEYVVVDFFVNMQIKTARLFLKLSNLTTGKDHGYYATPFYTALPRTFDFGISWRFFD
jgi:hypothetical protein